MNSVSLQKQLQTFRKLVLLLFPAESWRRFYDCFTRRNTQYVVALLISFCLFLIKYRNQWWILFLYEIELQGPTKYCNTLLLNGDKHA